MSNKNQQPVGAILGEQALNAAAKLMAEQFDYPWDFMPEQGRQKMRDNVKAIYAALSAPNHSEQVRHMVPQGWRLVPVEPTPAMRLVGARDCSALIQPDQAEEVYRAMLGAALAPTLAAPSAGSQGGDV